VPVERRNFLLGAAATLAAVPARPDTSIPEQSAALGAAGKDFPKVCGNLGNHNHSPLKKITAHNLDRLGGAWHLNLEGGSTAAPQQSTCVAENGILYVQTTQQNVFAVDGRTGALKWKTNLGMFVCLVPRFVFHFSAPVRPSTAKTFCWVVWKIGRASCRERV